MANNVKPKYVEKEHKKVDVWRYKKYLCKVKVINIQTGKRIVLLNTDEAKDHDVYTGYRTEVKFNSHSLVAIVDTSSDLINHGQVGIYKELAEDLGLGDGSTVEIVHLNRPASLEYIKKKMDGENLTDLQINTIVEDIMDGKLGEAETAAWVSAAYMKGFSDSEIVALANATVKSGDHLDLGKKGVVDKHCSGGVAGNRTTMLIVPIIACTELYIPKTSSRAITSAAGTADAVEVLAEVNFSIEELKEIVLKSHGAMVWGGGIKLAPVDDRLIRIRNPLSLDPEGMLLASILGKKKSVGAKYVIIDIPVGRGAKFADMDKAQDLAKHFIKIGSTMGMDVEALITDGAEPVGNGIGPGLECRDVLEVLEGQGPEDLRHKACTMAGKLLELCGKTIKGKGYDVANNLLKNGKALKKFREIIELQGGDGKVKSSDVPVGHYKYDVKADVDGQIFHIDNKVISKIARIAGAPMDKGAGIYLDMLRGDRVKKGDKLFTIHAESETKLDFAIKALKDLEPFEMRRMVLGVVDD
ncbi:AMP phosphorylase [Candidatus Micrarchaeota archaeon]|nr:AMP phosphorylase [Candidatus Micrarchaeota archaeon]